MGQKRRSAGARLTCWNAESILQTQRFCVFIALKTPMYVLQTGRAAITAAVYWCFPIYKGSTVTFSFTYRQILWHGSTMVPKLPLSASACFWCLACLKITIGRRRTVQYRAERTCVPSRHPSPPSVFCNHSCTLEPMLLLSPCACGTSVMTVAVVFVRLYCGTHVAGETEPVGRPVMD